MIREIINFTNGLLSDIPDIMQWNIQPDKGLHVFIDIDETGNWANQILQQGIDYDYYDGKNQDIKLWNDCIRYQEATEYITMNKVSKFDKKKKIHSCSPFAVAFNFNFNDKEKSELGIKIFKKSDKPSKEELKSNNALIRAQRRIVIEERLKDYQSNSLSIYGIKEKDGDLFSNQPFIYGKQIMGFFNNLHKILNAVELKAEYSLLTGKDYLHLYLRTIPIDVQEELHNRYVKQEIFSGEVMSKEHFGSVGFFTAYNQKKPFLRHRTSFLKDGVSQRFSEEDAITLYTFEKLLRRKPQCLPNPLPIMIDGREWNKRVIKLFNESGDTLSFRDLLKQLFAKYNMKSLPNYYLLNLSKTVSGIVINDFDFVPLFRYYLDGDIVVSNVTNSSSLQDKSFEREREISIKTIFDFERVAVREVFNNSLVKIKEDKYVTNYFGEIDSNYVIGGTLMSNLMQKYRKAIYAYIYKSDTNAINASMFDDIMYQSVLSNIKQDTFENKRFEWNNSIKKKINIWFSLYKMFNQNDKREYMVTKINELKNEISRVTKGETDLLSPESFAFGAGQLVSYLMDRSVSTNKTYAMLEPYLQKGKSRLLQDAIAQTVTVYKHDINQIYKGRFEFLASQVLTYGGDIDMKPLLKYFLAGCFSPCIIYEKTKEITNNN
ncbi:hypothetical protein [Segatella salivae]|jgi:hypothetical protein|uniref:hypothetical protein n=1 Tax=Segatella salivae TaxID=228604 RepID=UPI0028D90B6B|nr:hypothetical protein [Segatella salivae]